MGNIFENGVAIDALMEMGPVAEIAILPFLNDSSFPGSKRDAARKLLKAYNTRSELLFTQCIKDLGSTDGNCRNGALQWIAQSEVSNQRKADISAALNKSIENEGSLRNRDLVACLEKYGTSENAKKLIEILEANKLPGHETIRVLAKMRDPDGVKAIARQGANFFNGGEARKALKESGDLAEPSVIEVMTMTNDRGCRLKCIEVLGEIGTPNLRCRPLISVTTSQLFHTPAPCDSQAWRLRYANGSKAWLRRWMSAKDDCGRRRKPKPGATGASRSCPEARAFRGGQFMSVCTSCKPTRVRSRLS
ncbi:MAG: hypothetical protein EXR98_09380, partial [Gemmataceae bacterium]|nr:hypothetical protein [Gemmataceae bacterium]